MELQATSRRLQEQPITEDTSAEGLIAWSLERFVNQKMIITTSFGMEGCALIDMCARPGKPLTVVYLDTMFFFRETLNVRDRMVERYPHFDFVNCGTKLSPEEQAAQYGPELWKSDPDLCCRLRKVDPMYEVMVDTDVWVTGLRRSQSPTRANLRAIEWDWRYQVLKLSPLVRWERSEVWAYIQKNDVPYNELHEQGYPTIGCTHCTQPVPGSSPSDYVRTGRWTGIDKTECGLHGGEGI